MRITVKFDIDTEFVTVTEEDEIVAKELYTGLIESLTKKQFRDAILDNLRDALFEIFGEPEEAFGTDEISKFDIKGLVKLFDEDVKIYENRMKFDKGQLLGEQK